MTSHDRRVTGCSLWEPHAGAQAAPRREPPRGTPRPGQCWPGTCVVTRKGKRERLAAIWVFKTEKSLLSPYLHKLFMSKSKNN